MSEPLDSLLAQTYTNETVTLDPRLFVRPIQGLYETSTNATTIAESFASQLNELPVELVPQHLPTCSDNSVLCTQATYLFKTTKGSNISVAFIKGSFFELDYIVQDYSKWSNYWNNLTTANPSPAVASVTVGNLMLKAFGMDLSKVTSLHNFQSPQLRSLPKFFP